MCTRHFDIKDAIGTKGLRLKFDIWDPDPEVVELTIPEVSRSGDSEFQSQNLKSQSQNPKFQFLVTGSQSRMPTPD